MQCPKCESQEVYPCSFANKQGTVKSVTEGTVIGGGSGGLDQYDVRSETTSQTFLAKQAAPPEDNFARARGGLIALILTYIIIRVVAKLAGIMSLGWFGPIMFVLIAIAAVSTLVASRNRPQYFADLARWRESWICGRCGKIFVPPNPAS